MTNKEKLLQIFKSENQEYPDAVQVLTKAIENCHFLYPKNDELLNPLSEDGITMVAILMSYAFGKGQESMREDCAQVLENFKDRLN